MSFYLRFAISNLSVKVKKKRFCYQKKVLLSHRIKKNAECLILNHLSKLNKQLNLFRSEVERVKHDWFVMEKTY